MTPGCAKGRTKNKKNKGAPFRGAYTPEPIDIPFGTFSGLPDVITSAKLCFDRLSGFSVAAPPKSDISYTFSNDPCNSLHYRVTVILVEVGAFQWGWVSFKRKFQVEGDIAHQHSLVSKNRMITLSCGIKISAVGFIVSSQSTRVSDGRTDGQNYDPVDRASIAASRGKNECLVTFY